MHREATVKLVPGARLVGIDFGAPGDSGANEIERRDLGSEYARHGLHVAFANHDHDLALARLIIERRAGDARRYPARYAGQIGIIPCVGGRDPAAESHLSAALMHSRLTAVRSLRRAPDEPDETCWLAGDGWWLSTASVNENQSS